MATRLPCEKVSQELARELLIGISNSLPANITKPELRPEITNKANGFSLPNGDVADKYRSELISISDAQSPDALTPPVVLANNLG